ncbi:MAG: hypothetical protein H3C34_11715 [Caldilineaceae bacterium]|nr:hypothetical protein [Caldilineaceae bacterium]
MNIAKLYDLQKLDVNMEKVRRRVFQLRKAMGETEKLIAARNAVESTEAEQHEWQSTQRDAELQAQLLAQRIRESEQRLMGGAVRNPKELDSLQSSIESMRRLRAEQDDRGLEAIQRLDELAQRHEAERAALAEIESAWQSKQETISEEETKLKRVFGQLKRQRESVVEALDSAEINLYDTLRERKAGVAVAAVQNDLCGACNVKLPTGVVSAVHTHPDEAVYCPSCGRILYGG